ncbi:hypothetical protein MP228_004154 [Amoeboaphelidium protococcarum]|nr:hypothetical protein MP228_004154 [Amoeboaphelidium protococcarum]
MMGVMMTLDAAAVVVGQGKDRQHIVIIDAGSSGSRVYVYDAKSFQVLYNDKVTPGLSTIINFNTTFLHSKVHDLSNMNAMAAVEPEIIQFQKVVITYWTKLLNKVIAKYKDDFAFYIYATAGMRIIDSKDAHLIFNVTAAVLRDLMPSPHTIEDGNLKIISGQEEGLYGWISLNYLTHTLYQDYTVGFLDMGGASAQIAFQPSPDQVRLHGNDCVNISVVDFTHSSKQAIFNHTIYTTSFLGFGANQARKNYVEQVLQDQTVDPCLPKGFKTDVATSTAHKSVKGDGDYDKCRESLVPLLHKEAKCDDIPCIFNGVHSPEIPFDEMPFYGVSEYYYVSHDYGLDGVYNSQKFDEAAKKSCANYSKNDDKSTELSCFKSSWVSVMLHDGFGYKSTFQDFKSVLEINDTDVSWTLGAVIYLSSKTFISGMKLAGIDGQNKGKSGNNKAAILSFLLMTGLILTVAFGYRRWRRGGNSRNGGTRGNNGVVDWMNRRRYVPLDLESSGLDSSAAVGVDSIPLNSTKSRSSAPPVFFNQSMSSSSVNARTGSPLLLAALNGSAGEARLKRDSKIILDKIK